MTDPKPTVRVCFASYNTQRMSELCIRSMRATAGYPFNLTVGDCDSTDGSIPMFQRYEARGSLDLDIAQGGRRHGSWLDHWYATSNSDFLVFCDSDVEFLKANWLSAMIGTAVSTEAALVATRIQAVDGVAYQNPKTGAVATLAPRPEPWLMMLDMRQLRGRLNAGFAYEERVLADGTTMAYDTAAAFYRELTAHGFVSSSMPTTFASSYRHYSGLSWQRSGMPWRRRAKQVVKHAWVFVRSVRSRVAHRGAL